MHHSRTIEEGIAQLAKEAELVPACNQACFGPAAPRAGYTVELVDKDGGASQLTVSGWRLRGPERNTTVCCPAATTHHRNDNLPAATERHAGPHLRHRARALLPTSF